jgi:hypothetical protein
VPIQFHRIARDHREPAWVMLRDLGERRDRPRVAFDRDDSARALRQQSAGEPAGARTDLHHGDPGERAAGAGNPRGQVQVEKEVLAERLPGRQSMPPDRLAQRRQIVDGGHAGAAAAVSNAVSRAARRMAAIRLDGSARPVPAMSKAVP